MTFERYKEECEKRWWGVALSDALRNFHAWEEMHDELVGWLRLYKANTGQKYGDKWLNPDHSLSGFMWLVQERLQPDRSKLNPFLDFEENYQKVFLRRGLLIYCGAILDDLRAECATPPGQATLFTYEKGNGN